jgi:hypothetical protein
LKNTLNNTIDLEPVVTFSFRALAILEEFIIENADIDEWIIPSSICFTVPALFYKAKKKVLFYDFGYNPNLILSLIIDKRKQGVLICSYYGVKWTLDHLKLIKSHCEILIEDACLEIPITRINQVSERILYSDLLLFSTGSGKQLDLGYGAIGYSKKKFYKAVVSSNIQSCDTSYRIIDSKWKEIIVQKDDLHGFLKLIGTEWINNSILNDTLSYINQIENKKKEVIEHKRNINKIYKEAIPKSFWFINNLRNWRFNIIVDRPEIFIQELFSKNLFASRHYVNLAQIFNNDYSLENSHFIEKHIVNLFNDFNMTSDGAFEIANIFKYLHKKRKINALNNYKLR